MRIQSKTDFNLFKRAKLSARVKFGKTLVENAQAWAMFELPFFQPYNFIVRLRGRKI